MFLSAFAKESQRLISAQFFFALAGKLSLFFIVKINRNKSDLNL
jgi:hypothetical protein